jgi:hypothetical protein
VSQPRILTGESAGEIRAKSSHFSTRYGYHLRAGAIPSLLRLASGLCTDFVCSSKAGGVLLQVGEVETAVRAVDMDLEMEIKLDFCDGPSRV